MANYSNITDPEDPRYPITRPMYLASVPESFVGTRRYSYGDMRVDQLTMGNMARVRLPIVTLAEFAQAGAKVSIVKRADVVKIYNATQKYLLHWLSYIRTAPLNRATMPTEDLLILDEFANSIYEPAAYDAALQPEQVVSFQSMLGNDLVLEQLMRQGAKPEATKITPRESLDADIYRYSEDLSSRFDTSETMLPISTLLNQD